MPHLRGRDPAVPVTLLVALIMIASQVAGKAARDALFLSSFSVTSLPMMVIASAFVSLGAVLLASRMMALNGPKKIIQLAFAASGLTIFGEWRLWLHFPEVASVVFYLHQVVVGSILVSGFWSIVNESSDLQVVKSRIPQIACAGAAGGIMGCVVTERAAAELSISALLPVLAVMHLLCALMIYSWKMPSNRPLEEEEKNAAIAAEAKAFGFAFHVLKRHPYARDLAALILLGAISATLVSYAFKAHAAETFKDTELLRFFALFYTILSVLTLIVQATLSRVSLERLGGAKTSAILPSAVGLSSLLAVLFPGFMSAVLTRGIESVVRNSIFRTGYEFLYTPLSKREKRSTKSVIDVGFDRLGDVVGGGTIHLVILLGGGIAPTFVLGLTTIISMLALLLTGRLYHGYIKTLEKRLLRSAPHTGPQAWTETVLVEENISPRLNPLAVVASEPAFVLSKPEKKESTRTPTPSVAADDLTNEHFARLRGDDPDEIIAVLRNERPLDPVLAPQVIRLVHRREVSGEATKALEIISGSITGLLTDVLLDQNEDPSIRCHIPQILRVCASQRAVDGLVESLRDPQFEIRFQSGRALVAIREGDPSISISSELICETLKRELISGSFTSKGPQFSELFEKSYFIEGIPLDRVDWHLEHAFTLLSLIVSRDRLKIALQGLHSTENSVQATALEYLSSVLPGPIRFELQSLLDAMSRRS